MLKLWSWIGAKARCWERAAKRFAGNAQGMVCAFTCQAWYSMLIMPQAYYHCHFTSIHSITNHVPVHKTSVLVNRQYDSNHTC